MRSLKFTEHVVFDLICHKTRNHHLPRDSCVSSTMRGNTCYFTIYRKTSRSISGHLSYQRWRWWAREQREVPFFPVHCPALCQLPRAASLSSISSQSLLILSRIKWKISVLTIENLSLCLTSLFCLNMIGINLKLRKLPVLFITFHRVWFQCGKLNEWLLWIWVLCTIWKTKQNKTVFPFWEI